MDGVVTFFDLDQTLRKGFIITELPDYLRDNNLFDEKAADAIDYIIDEYRKGNISYRNAGYIVPIIYGFGINGKSCEEVEEKCKGFIEETRDALMPFAEELVEMMADVGEIALKSGSPKEAVKPFAESLGFKHFTATEFDCANGKYDGSVKRNLILAEEKQKCFDEGVKELKADTSKSFAFGDTLEDFPMLIGVKYGFLVNPSEELAEKAREEGITCVTEKDIIEKVRETVKEIE